MESDLTAWGTATVYAFLRSLGFTAFLPLGKGVLLRAILALGFAAPWLSPTTSILTPSSAFLEFLLGALIGLPMGIVASTAVLAGQLLESSRGQNLGELFNPFSQSTSTVAGTLLQSIVWSMLLISGAFAFSYQTLAKSAFPYPLGTLGPHFFTNRIGELIPIVVEVLTKGAVFVLPFVTVCLIVDIAGGFTAKILPQLAISQETFTIKAGLSLLLLSTCSDEALGGALTAFIASALKGLVS